MNAAPKILPNNASANSVVLFKTQPPKTMLIWKKTLILIIPVYN